MALRRKELRRHTANGNSLGNDPFLGLLRACNLLRHGPTRSDAMGSRISYKPAFQGARRDSSLAFSDRNHRNRITIGGSWIRNCGYRFDRLPDPEDSNTLDLLDRDRHHSGSFSERPRTG